MDRSILIGAYDIHVHAGPSGASRYQDAGEMLLEAQDAGYAGFVVKDHYIPALLGTKMVEKHLGKGSTKAYGCMVLNNSIGGLNLNAVDKAYQYGAAFVSLPTVSSKMHLDSLGGKVFVGSTKSDVIENPIAFTDINGNVVHELVNIIKYMAEHDMALATGHAYVSEIDSIVDKANELGLKRILITHPHYQVNASIEDMKRWASKGAVIELTSCVFKGGHSVVENVVELEVAKNMIEEVGVDNVIISSDFGQKKNGSIVNGLYNFLVLLNERCGIPEEYLRQMITTNVTKLINFKELKKFN